MNKQLQIFTGVAAGVLILIGLGIGLWPVTGANDVSCGTAFFPADTRAEDAGRNLGAFLAGRPEYETGVCDGELNNPMVAWVLIGLGALGSGIWLWREQTPAVARD